MGNFIFKIIRGIAIGVFLGGALAVVGLGAGGAPIGFIVGLVISFNMDKKANTRGTSYSGSSGFTRSSSSSHISRTPCDRCGSRNTRVTTSDYLQCNNCGYKKA